MVASDFGVSSMKSWAWAVWGKFLVHTFGPLMTTNYSLNATVHLSIVGDHLGPVVYHLLIIMHHVKKKTEVSNRSHQQDIIRIFQWPPVFQDSNPVS